MVGLRYVERNLRRELLLEKSEALKDRRVRASNVDQEVVVVESLELDLDIRHLHNLVDFAILLAANELAVLVGELDLEANLMVEGLQEERVVEVREAMRDRTK